MSYFIYFVQKGYAQCHLELRLKLIQRQMYMNNFTLILYCCLDMKMNESF